MLIKGRNTDTYTMEYRFYRALFILGLFFLITGLCFSEETIHIIKQGETIYSIARSYGVSPQDVLNYNKISDARTVQAGAKIRIPGTEAKRSSGTETKGYYDEYKVEKNDTLYGLARRYNISLPDLLDMNGFAPNYVIKTGEKIRVPALSSSQQPNQAGNNAKSGAVTPPPVTPAAPTTPIRLDPSIKWPIKAKEISNITGKLNGVQLTGERQESVKSLSGGTVVSAGPYRGFGKVAIVQASGGYLYVYGGCETLSVKEGDKVVSGTELGRLGIDTKSAKSQLFFFVYRGNSPIDPSKAPRA